MDRGSIATSPAPGQTNQAVGTTHKGSASSAQVGIERNSHLSAQVSKHQDQTEIIATSCRGGRGLQDVEVTKTFEEMAAQEANFSMVECRLEPPGAEPSSAPIDTGLEPTFGGCTHLVADSQSGCERVRQTRQAPRS